MFYVSRLVGSVLMGNVFEYLEWRGEIPFSEVKVKNADYAIFCCLAYIPFEGVFTTPGVSLKEAAGKVLEQADKEGSQRVFQMKEDERLLRTLINSPRFAQLPIIDYTGIFDEERQEQFCAVTFALTDRKLLIAFRGTDRTVIGWKEDLNMGFSSTIPSQREAVEYVESVAKRYPKRTIYLCGHSKGGNLAMYSAAFCSGEVQKRIAEVRNMDGPGFMEEILQQEGFRNIIDRTITFVPQSSIVGMLLEHQEEYHVVHSQKLAPFQHHVYSWEIRRSDFVEEEGTTNTSRRLDAALKKWVLDITPQQRAALADGLFDVIRKSDAKTLDDLVGGRCTLAFIRELSKTDSETKELVAHAYKLFKQALKQRKKDSK